MFKEKLQGYWNNKWVKIVTVLLVLVFVYAVGVESAKVEMGEEKLTAEELQGKVKSLEEEVGGLETEKQTLNDEISTLQDEVIAKEEKLSDLKAEHEDVYALVDNKGQLEEDVKTLESELGTIQTDIENAKSELDIINGEIAAASGKLQEIDEAPVELASGQYFVGQDFPAGRYKATNVGQGSNFIVYSSSGTLKVNTILGEDWGYGDYVFYAEEGDLVETAAKVKLIPVE